ncbi:hypothetical protein [Candidatus Pelagibacter bacterium nBUS_36]|uniref:hypothetical protein n=1 Tax=Candidatus Pelagibacter bacterium nBUS_36 TaxID=3374194 RepID=UPI003EBE0DD5
MKKIITKYLTLTIAIIVLIILYLSTIGLETDKFNNQIKDKVSKTNKNLEIELKKIKLTLDPFNFKVNAKTIGTNIIYKGTNLELEYIETQISLISLFKNEFRSSNLNLSTKSILLKDLVAFIRATTNKPELFILESAIKNGQIVADVELNFDENGKIKNDYKIRSILKNGKIKFLNIYNFEKINFNLDVKDNVLNFKDLSFITNKINFFSDNFKITQNKKDFLFEGEIQNQNAILNDNLLQLLNLNFKYLNFLNTNFISKNIFSFNIDKKFKIKNLVINSDIQIDKSEYKNFSFLDNYLLEAKDLIYIEDHKIKISYKKDNFTAQGSGKVKLSNQFDEIKYSITNTNNDFKLSSNISLSELKFRNQDFLKPFFPKLNDLINFKNQKIEINFDKKNLSIKGSGKIKLDKDFDEITYYISKKENEFNFDTQIDLDKTLLNIDFLNFKKNKKDITQIKLKGNYDKNKKLNLKEISIYEKNNKIILQNLLLDENNLIIKFDKMDLNYLDKENKINKFLILRKKKNEYFVNGSSFNAKKLIDNLFKNKNNDDYKIFKNNINLSSNLKNIYIGDDDIVSDFKGMLEVKNNKVVKAEISALFDKSKNLSFTINTNNNGEKITTLFSSRAKPIVKKYKFIKGFEDGYLDFYSSKIENVSRSKLKIYNFKLKELPALTKLLTLASLQGIADTLSGEGIRFDEFEMNFTNKDELMTIDEIYAIGPAISILISGYVEEDKLISLRGTLVPATTLNKTIGSVPFLGKILVGDKTGEGVFGVSFKIKGPPKNLATTVNPIKTLTPRFITRTLEKIKKN